MEVHKHPHHVTHKKQWKEYLLEFFMLFLAVFLGFVAENVRENAADNHRERQYMQSILKDLAADTTMFTKGIQRKEQRIMAIDTAFMFFKAHPDAQTISGKFFRTLRRTTFDQLLIRNNITINQLKNAGGMHLIRDQSVTDSISAYDFQIESYQQYNIGYLTHQEVAYRNIEKMVDASDMLDLYISNNSDAIFGNIPDSIVIRINNADLNGELNFMMQLKVFARQELNRFKDLKNTAINLMAMIKNKYHLKDE